MTFDDGPTNGTLSILDVLARKNVKATFFVNGLYLLRKGGEREISSFHALERMIREGHSIANHGFDHFGAVDIGPYHDVHADFKNFIHNAEFIRASIRNVSNLSLGSSDLLSSVVRLPFTSTWRIPEYIADCACCTLDFKGQKCKPEFPSNSSKVSSAVANKLASNGFSVFGWDVEWEPKN